MYTYTQSSQIQGQTGCIGHLRGDMDSNGEGFYTSWDDHRRYLKTDAFKAEFDEVINSLRFDEQYEGVLKNRSSLLKYCNAHRNCIMDDGRSYGIRVDTNEYAYMCRLNPNKGEYNFYIYAYKRAWLDQHLKQAERGIRFIDPNYNEKFRIPDGGKIKITDKDGTSETFVCRYIDDYHLEVHDGRNNLFHICEFAERMENNGRTVEPVSPVMEQNKRKEKTNAGIDR